MQSHLGQVRLLREQTCCCGSRKQVLMCSMCTQVYLTLTAMLLVSAVGVGVAQILSFGTWIPVIGFVACMFFLISTPPTASNLNKRQVPSCHHTAAYSCTWAASQAVLNCAASVSSIAALLTRHWAWAVLCSVLQLLPFCHSVCSALPKYVA